MLQKRLNPFYYQEGAVRIRGYIRVKNFVKNSFTLKFRRNIVRCYQMGAVGFTMKAKVTTYNPKKDHISLLQNAFSHRIL